MAARRKRVRVEIRRDGMSGYLYSRVVDIDRPNGLTRADGRTYEVVIDRQKGRTMDAETLQRRAQYLAELLGVPIDVDLTWPCIASLGLNQCRCPQCVRQA